MSTGDRRVSIYLKKFLPQQQMQENFQFLLQKYSEDLYARVFPDSGVYFGGLFSSSAPDTIDISTPLEGSQSEGKDIIFDPSLGTAVPFENELGVEYSVGLQFTNIPANVEVNVRTGKLKYVFNEEAIGERADPTLVVDDADGTMTIRVDSVTEAGVDHSGRTVKVFLKGTEVGGAIGPQTQITPFEDLVVQYDGTNNFIETTTGLGQIASNISTDASDYEVVLLGPSIKRNTDLQLIANVIFLGTVTGAGVGNNPTVFDQTGRRRLSSGATALAAQVLSLLETQGTLRHSETVVGEITWSSNLFYRPLGVAGEIQVNASTITLADGEVAFIEVPTPFAPSISLLQKTDRSSGGLASFDRYWVFHRDGNIINVRGGLALEQGEERQLNDVVIGNVIYLSNDDKIRYSDSDNIFHLDADGGTDNADLAIGTTINYGDPTNNDKITYVAGLLTVLLGNSVTGSAVSAGRFVSQRTLATDTAFEALVTADAVSRVLVQSDGKVEWSDGALAADTDLFREGVGILATTNILKSLLGTLRLNDIDMTRDSSTLLSVASNFKVTNGTLTLNDLNLVRESATLLGVLADIRSSTGIFRAATFANNDFIRFVEGGTPFWEILTNNVQRLKVDETGNVTAANNLISTNGVLTLTDVNIARESTSLIGILADIRSSTGIFRAATFANNDFIRFVEGGTPFWEILTNNVQRMKVDETGNVTATNNLISTNGVLTLNDVNIARETATLIGILADIRSSTGVFRAGPAGNNDTLKFIDGGSPSWSFLLNNVERWRIEEVGNSVASRDHLTKSSLGYVKPSTGAIIIDVNASLNEVYDRTKSRDLLKISANNAADQAINVAGSRISLTSTEEVGLINSDLDVVNFAGSTINFNTGVVSVGSNFTPYIPSGAVRFFKYGIVLDTLNQLVIVLPSGDDAVRANAPEPNLSGGIPIGVITVESITAASGDVQTIIEEDILFFGASGGGGGGGTGATQVEWLQIPGVAPFVELEDNVGVARFEAGEANKLVAYITVPDGHSVTTQVKMRVGVYSPSIINTILMKTTTYLIRKDTDALSSVVNNHLSGNSAITNSGTTKAYRQIELELTDVAGKINSLDVTSGDMIRVEIDRGVDTDTDDIRFVLLASATEVSF